MTKIQYINYTVECQEQSRIAKANYIPVLNGNEKGSRDPSKTPQDGNVSLSTRTMMQNTSKICNCDKNIDITKKKKIPYW